MIIGITERGDAGIDFSWTNKIQKTDYSVIITKNTTTERFHREAIQHRNKMLLHATITGWGGTPVEPHVPNPISSIASVCNLVNEGFPSEQIVWRIDPILPINGDEGIKHAHLVFKNIDVNKHLHNVTRIRVSVFDAYPHALKRLAQINASPNFTGFSADDATFKRINEMLDYWKSKGYEIEACAEPRLHATHIGCVNTKDAEHFGIDISNLPQNGQNRFGCLCYTAKTELLSNRKQCPHGCRYCYWK